MREKVRRRT